MFNCKIIDFLSCISILIVRKFQKWRHFAFIFSRYSNSFLTKTTGVISSIRVDIQNFLVVEEFLMGEVTTCVPGISVLTVRNVQEMLLLLIRLAFKLIFLRYYNFEFLYHEHSLKHNTCRGILRWKPLILFVVSESGSSKISRKNSY